MLNKNKKIVVTDRDFLIEKALDRFGALNDKQIQKFLNTNGFEIELNAVQVRLGKLVAANRLKRLKTHLGTYYSLTIKSKGNNQLINSISLDRLDHEDWCKDIVINHTFLNFLTSREIRSKIEFGKTGPIPDLILLDADGEFEYLIEYERTRKSKNDTYNVLKNHIYSTRRSNAAVIIVADASILNHYQNIIIDSDFEILDQDVDPLYYKIAHFESRPNKFGNTFRYEGCCAVNLLTYDMFLSFLDHMSDDLQ